MTPSSNLHGPISKKWFQSRRFLVAAIVCASLVVTGFALAQSAGQTAATGQPPAASQQVPPGKGIQPDLEYPILPIGAPAPDFDLPGVDGKNHTLGEYSKAKILAVVFECNHCPVSQLYEERVENIYQDYKDKGVAVVAINPNNPKAIQLQELAYTDVGDSLAEMKIRAAFRHIDYPYLYDGDTQTVAMKFGAVATPHIFIFDQDRKLQYQGRIDDNMTESLAKSHDARNAIDALLADKPVPGGSHGRLRLLHQVEVEDCERRGIPEGNRSRAGDARRCHSRHAEEAARQSDRQAATGELLGDVVRPVRGRVSRS
jgi:peroxiredoxin